MTISITHRDWIKIGSVGGSIAVSLVVFLAIQLPNLHQQRTSLDADRLSLATFIEQRSNLSKLEQQAEELLQLQTKLSPEIWRFESEPQFFSTWDTFGRDHRVTIEVVQVSDVVPGNQPVRRSAQLSIQGSISAILASLDALSSIQPLVSIQTVKLQPGTTVDQLDATIDLETVWQ